MKTKIKLVFIVISLIAMISLVSCGSGKTGGISDTLFQNVSPVENTSPPDHKLTPETALITQTEIIITEQLSSAEEPIEAAAETETNTDAPPEDNAILELIPQDEPIPDHETAPSAEEPDTKIEQAVIIPTGNALSFPYLLENGSLSVNSVFQSSIPNPDCGNEYQDNIVSIEFVNHADQHLKEARLELLLDNGRTVPFIITEVPTGKTVWAFACDNQSMSPDTAVLSITCQAVFTDQPSLLPEILFRSSETEITITNQSAESYQNITVRCHCLFDGVYFGGITYDYPIESLSANQTVTVDAFDCFLGEADVVSITN